MDIMEKPIQARQAAGERNRDHAVNGAVAERQIFGLTTQEGKDPVDPVVTLTRASKGDHWPIVIDAEDT